MQGQQEDVTLLHFLLMAANTAEAESTHMDYVLTLFCLVMFLLSFFPSKSEEGKEIMGFNL